MNVDDDAYIIRANAYKRLAYRDLLITMYIRNFNIRESLAHLSAPGRDESNAIYCPNRGFKKTYLNWILMEN